MPISKKEFKEFELREKDSPNFNDSCIIKINSPPGLNVDEDSED